MNESNTTGGGVMKVPTPLEREQFRDYALRNLSSPELAMVTRLIAALEHLEAELDAKTEVALSVGNDLFVYGSAAATEKCQGDLMAADGLGHIVDELTAERDALGAENARLASELKDALSRS